MISTSYCRTLLESEKLYWLVREMELREILCYAKFWRNVSSVICRFLLAEKRLLWVLPFRKITMKSRIFVSWVGLRGAVPIIFATYPVVAGVEGSNLIFNIVFFITIVSLVVQGTTISFVARILNLSKPLEKTGNDFGVELPEEIDSDLSDMTITKSMLEEADTLKYMNLPKGTLVMIVKRRDEFLIPNGTLKLHEGDKLLLISEKSKEEDTDSE